MASSDRIPSRSEDSENTIFTDIAPMSEEFIDFPITTIENQDTSICQQLFDKFEYFKKETAMLSDSETMKKRLNQSISLWNELLNMANNVNKQNKFCFDANRALVTKVFSDINETDLFNNDNDFSRQIFFGYLDLLNTSEIQQFLTTLAPSTLADAIRESNIYILLFILSTLCRSIIFLDSDIADQYNPLLNAMRVHVDQKLQTTVLQQHANERLISVHQRILLLLWDSSDRTVVVPSLLRTGFGKSVIEWLNYPTLTDTARRPIVSIVHNLSRHDNGVDELNKYGAIETINQMQQLDSVRQSTMLLINTMALALLSTPNQIKADPTGTKPILDQLLQITINASIAEKYRYNGFHVSEPLAVLVKLFVDDTTFDYVMNQAETHPPSNPISTIKLFSDLLISFHVKLKEKNRLEQFTFIALFNILWSISFHEVYHHTLKQHIELMDIIQNVAKYDCQIIIEQYVPRLMQSVKKAADGILFNLSLEIPSITIPLVHPISAQQKPLVMLSYSHVNNDFCDKILEILDQKTDLFDVWIDKRCCKNSVDIWESIAKGIKNSDLIICIISSEYLTSKACRQEIIYAKDRLNKRFLPVYLGKPNISDWLGKTCYINIYIFVIDQISFDIDIRLAEFKYVRFQNTHLKLDERKVEELLSTVVEFISPGHATQNNITIRHHHTSSFSHELPRTEVIRSQSTLTTSQPVEIVENRNKPILKWTQDDIHYWFLQHNICSEIRDMYQFKTGAQMITYAECLKDGWQKQYERYAPRYVQRYPDKELLEHEFALFTSALKQLLSK
ncbi:unnamed protein product [Rotaria sp. Silwood2]|nr:unnamed protein product [Rotaria sp. Silwood2]